jgi:phosphoribosylaminoimidazole-succinocarboxamide synthase
MGSDVVLDAKIYQGKAKEVWSTRDPDQVVLRFTDAATAFNGVKKASIDEKGQLNLAMSVKLFEVVEAAGVPTHVVRSLNETDLLCHRVEILPVEVVVRSVVAGSFARRYGLEEGTELAEPLVELFHKSDALDDPLVNDDAAVALGWARRWELQCMKELALQTHAALSAFWGTHGIRLVDAKYEFGRTAAGALVLADELTPDGCRLWEEGTQRKLDKDVFRRDLADLGDTYRELHQRVFGG